MRLPGQLSAAIEVLTDIDTRHRPAAAALRDWGLSHRFAGSGDRAAIGNIVYDALRRRRSLAWRMDGDTPRSIALGAVGLEWQANPQNLADLVAADTHGPGALSAAEMECLRGSRPVTDAPEAVQADVPDWCAGHIRESLGAGWLEECRALAGRPPLDLRVNTLKSGRERVLAQLGRINPEPCRLSPVGIRVPPTGAARRHPNIQSDEAWQRGRVEVQDEGSQLCALAAGLKPGDQMLDLCAGAGGKTLAFAAIMENKGQIYAYDSDRNRLAGIYDRLKRAGVRNVQVRQPDGDNLSDLAERMDTVFVDAPCSGSGVWRRHPDAKWRLTPQLLQSRLEEQAAALDQAAAYVRPGGTLVYVTCSLFAPENRGQIETFRQRFPHFQPVPLEERFTGIAGAGAASAWFAEDDAIQLTPARSGTDGFYVACLRRDP
ncbi:MAG TPA: RsmB/NOP family class I SAM-dependent RNA methyltransferase [Afifellaceae bacterium]|nr:RsmB/NOP family class I SAM-dependent RNA methyltransferase [Afifellaceae bacterium]